MKYYSIIQVAERLSLSKGTVRNWVCQGRIKAVKVFGATRISEDEIKRIVVEQNQSEKSSS